MLFNLACFISTYSLNTCSQFILTQVWSHFDTGNCPGQAVGVKVRLDNGIQGFIHTKMLSDSKVKNPEDRVKVGH